MSRLLKRCASMNDQKDSKQSKTRKLANMKSIDENDKVSASSLLSMSISDCTCPICLEILIEPVVMPCNHELCLPCFKNLIEQTNFLCPMCRMRISTWSRNASNSNCLVNTERWNQIKKAFPIEIKNRMEGKTAQLLAESIKNQQLGKDDELSTSSSVKLSKPGEIGKDYQDYLKREQERIRLEKEKEEQLSIAFIQRVIQEEESLTMNDYLARVNENPTRQATASNNETRQMANITNSVANQISSINNEQLTINNSATPKQVFRGIERAASFSVSNRVNNKEQLNALRSRMQMQRIDPPLLENRPVAAIQTPSTTESTSASSIESSTSSLISRLRPRASLRKTHEEAAHIRGLNQIKQVNHPLSSNLAHTDTGGQQIKSRAKSAKASTSNSLNGSDLSESNSSVWSNNDDETLDSLTKRRSLRPRTTKKIKT